MNKNDSSMVFELACKDLNYLQIDSLLKLIRMAKHAHHIDVVVRINGEDQLFQADWIKHITPPPDDIGHHIVYEGSENDGQVWHYIGKDHKRSERFYSEYECRAEYRRHIGDGT